MLIGLTIYLSGREMAAARFAHCEKERACRENPGSPIVKKWRSSHCSRFCRCSRSRSSAINKSSTPISSGRRENANLVFFGTQNADDLADHARFDLVGQLSRGRSSVLATLVEKVSRAGGNHQDGHRQHHRGDRFHLARNLAQRSPRAFRNESFNRLAHHLPSAQQHRVRERLSRSRSRSIARVAPAALSATIIGIYYLHLFAANNLVGWIGGLLEKMPATQFWLLHAALVWNSRHHLSHRRPPLRPCSLARMITERTARVSSGSLTPFLPWQPRGAIRPCRCIRSFVRIAT